LVSHWFTKKQKKKKFWFEFFFSPVWPLGTTRVLLTCAYRLNFAFKHFSVIAFQQEQEQQEQQQQQEQEQQPQPQPQPQPFIDATHYLLSP